MLYFEICLTFFFAFLFVSIIDTIIESFMEYWFLKGHKKHKYKLKEIDGQIKEKTDNKQEKEKVYTVDESWLVSRDNPEDFIFQARSIRCYGLHVDNNKTSDVLFIISRFLEDIAIIFKSDYIEKTQKISGSNNLFITDRSIFTDIADRFECKLTHFLDKMTNPFREDTFYSNAFILYTFPRFIISTSKLYNNKELRKKLLYVDRFISEFFALIESLRVRKEESGESMINLANAYKNNLLRMAGNLFIELRNNETFSITLGKYR